MTTQGEPALRAGDACDLAAAAVTVVRDQVAPLIERVMTQHWDFKACHCWFCEEGRRLGFGPRERYRRLVREEPLTELGD